NESLVVSNNAVKSLLLETIDEIKSYFSHKTTVFIEILAQNSGYTEFFIVVEDDVQKFRESDSKLSKLMFLKNKWGTSGNTSTLAKNYSLAIIYAEHHHISLSSKNFNESQGKDILTSAGSSILQNPQKLVELLEFHKYLEEYVSEDTSNQVERTIIPADNTDINSNEILISGKSLDSLDTEFKKLFVDLVNDFYIYIKQQGKEWKTLTITSTVRTDQEQAVDMVALYNGASNSLMETYGFNHLAQLCYPILDASIKEDRVHSNYQKALKENDLPQEMKEDLKKIVDISLTTLKRREYAVSFIVKSFLYGNKLGKAGAHRDSIKKAVDISKFSTQEDLKKFINSNSKYSNISYTDKYEDGHLHISVKGWAY
ncbi:MAG: hypothetical protein ACRCY4_10775, partial [Brevinema sp.]